MIIGRFTRTDGKIRGFIKAFGVDEMWVNIVSTGSTFALQTNGPDPNAICDLGFGKKMISQNNREYIFIVLKSPFLPTGVPCHLYENRERPGTFNLVWYEPKTSATGEPSGNNVDPDSDIPF